MSWCIGIRFHSYNNSNTEECCDICGVNHKELIESDVFDNGNCSETQIHLCRSCVRNLDFLFEELK